MTLGIFLVANLAAWSRIGMRLPLQLKSVKRDGEFRAKVVSCASNAHAGVGYVCSRSLLCGSHLVPGLPECFHLIRLSQRDSCVRIHRRKGTADIDIVLLKVINHGANRA